MCVQRPVVRTAAHQWVLHQQGRAVFPQIQSTLGGRLTDTIVLGERVKETISNFRAGENDSGDQSASEYQIMRHRLLDDEE